MKPFPGSTRTNTWSNFAFFFNVNSKVLLCQINHLFQEVNLYLLLTNQLFQFFQPTLKLLILTRKTLRLNNHFFFLLNHTGILFFPFINRSITNLILPANL